MKIVLSIQHFAATVGGAEGFAVSVVRELVNRGHQVCVVANDGTPLDGVKTVFGPLDLAIQEKDAFAADLHIDWGLHVSSDLHRLGGGTHRQFLDYALQAYPQPWRLLKKLSYAVMNKHRHAAKDERQLARCSGASFLAVSEFVAEQLRRCAAPYRPAVHVLHNGVDVERFSPERLPRMRPSTRQKLGLVADDVACLFVAHNLRLKNFALLKAFFGRLHRQNPHIKLVLLGKRSPGITAPWFIYAGPTSAPEHFYAAADLLLHPTYYDACANVVLEALASGLPVISSNRNGSAEIMEHGKHGFVLPVTGQKSAVREQWMAAIDQLATDSSLRAAMSREARQLACHHSLASYVDQFEKILRTVATKVSAKKT